MAVVGTKNTKRILFQLTRFAVDFMQHFAFADEDKFPKIIVAVLYGIGVVMDVEGNVFRGGFERQFDCGICTALILWCSRRSSA